MNFKENIEAENFKNYYFKMKKEEQKSLDDLWNEGSDYVSQSIDDVIKDLKSKFKKNTTSIYLMHNELDNILSINKEKCQIYFDKGFGKNYLDRYYTETIAGNYLIFDRFKEYRGVKLYEISDDTGIYLLENKRGNRYMFHIDQASSIKGIKDTLVFVDYDGYITVYDIESDSFIE